MIERKKAYGLFVQFHYGTENVDKHIYEANKVHDTTHNVYIHFIHTEHVCVGVSVYVSLVVATLITELNIIECH